MVHSATIRCPSLLNGPRPTALASGLIGASAYSCRADERKNIDIYGYKYGYSSLESVIESSKESYYLGRRRTHGTIRSEAPVWEPWIIYFLQSLRQQKSRVEATIKRERLMVERLPELSVQILELAKAHGRITNSQVVDMTGANRNTVKKHLQMLVSGKHLVQHGSGKATYYSRV